MLRPIVSSCDLAVEILGGFDFVVGTLGENPRCLTIPGLSADMSADRFAIPHASVSQDVEEELASWGFSISTYNRILEAVADACAEHESTRVLVDISTMAKTTVVELIGGLSRLEGIEVVLAYVPGEFSQPPNSVTIESFGPMTIDGDAMIAFGELPLAAVLGLGYEPQKALGIVETLEPQSAWLFLPRSPDERYDQAAEEANRTLLKSVPESRAIHYDVANPAAAFRRLDGLVTSLSHGSRVVLIPNGPKIFAAVSMLVQIGHPRASIWQFKSSFSPRIGSSPSDTRIALKFEVPRRHETTDA